MKERGIIFNTEMVRALLDSRKTQTRRVIKPQPQDHHWENDPLGRYKHHLNLFECQRGLFLSSWHSIGDHIDSSKECNQQILCPYGVPGDRLYVRETWALIAPSYRYKADGDWDTKEKEMGEFSRWKPSIHMPKDAARIWLEITDIRVERVQEITEQDAIAEGIEFRNGYWMGGLHEVKGTHKCRPFARAAFIDLWDSINEKRGYGWSANPWVWVVEFRVINREVENAN